MQGQLLKNFYKLDISLYTVSTNGPTMVGLGSARVAGFYE